jgi:hypothetical protein
MCAVVSTDIKQRAMACPPLFVPDFAVSIVAGNGLLGYAEGVGSAAQFAFPFGVAYQFDAKTDTSRLVVADQANRRFRTIDLKSGSSHPSNHLQSCADSIVSLTRG